MPRSMNDVYLREIGNMGINFSAYLQARGFSANPFATTNAEQEVEYLPSFFVRVAWFDQLVGDPQNPQSLILFAPQGHGKTSHRLEVARIASERRDAPALVVTLNDLSLLVHDGIDHVSLNTYVSIIRRLTLEALDSYLLATPLRQTKLQLDPDLFARYCALLRLYAPLRLLDKQVPSTIDVFTSAFERVMLGAKEWLQEIAYLARCAGCASVYVLLDGVDELQETRSSPDRACKLLQPLLDAPGLLQGSGFAFKFFLPQELEEPIRRLGIGRLDRIPVRSLTWTPAQLLHMLSQRLNSYSLISATAPIGRINRFQDLCETSGIDIDSYLVEAAFCSPRRLLDLTRQIVEHHCIIASSVEEPIRIDTVYSVVASVMSPALARPAQLPPPQSVDGAIMAEDALPLLYLDEKGDIWLGQKLLEENLPKRLRQCLEYLWSNRHRSIRYDELLEAVYGHDLQERGDPRSSLDKLIRRLRETLEPGQTSSHTYIEVRAGIGYVLRNFREQ
jgi:hypothetical protein